jgi:phytoene synthase
VYVDDLSTVLRHDADMRECRTLLKKGSHSFFAASLLLPKEVRQPVTALYAFCRVSDDAIDLAADPRRGLDELHRRLRKIYNGAPDKLPVDRAFADVVQRYRIPYTLPAALLEGFEWDVFGRRYPSLSDTYDYCARVAGTVGVMMAMLMGIRDPAILSRACDLGVAMQLTNIARDVGEDAAAGRVYLPTDMLRSNGVNVSEWMQEPAFNAGIGVSVKEILELADRLYARAEWGIAQLPFRVRPGIFAARLIYAEIGREIARRNFDSVNDRAVVPGGRKARLMLTALSEVMSHRHRDHAPPLREARFLIEAISHVPQVR